jgi:DNA-binding PadR family transcriptional regulator
VPTRDVDARSFLPLSPLTFLVLLAMAEAERHGYAIIQEIEARNVGLRLRTGNLYTVLQRLRDQALIEESDARPARGDDRRRRYYGLTLLGRAVLVAETGRLEALVGAARLRRVPGRSSKP